MSKKCRTTVVKVKPEVYPGIDRLFAESNDPVTGGKFTASSNAGQKNCRGEYKGNGGKRNSGKGKETKGTKEPRRKNRDEGYLER
jgi:hypothetical protein